MKAYKVVEYGVVNIMIQRCHKFVESGHFPQLQIPVASNNMH